MDDQVLSLSNRGHTASDTENAVWLLKKRGYQVGIQMMIGLPGDDETKSLRTGERLASLSPDFVRIYPTLVFEKTLLAWWYKTGKYMPMSLEAAVTHVKKLYNLFREKDIPVIRMGLQAAEYFEKETVILAGPYHPAFGHLVYSETFLDEVLKKLEHSEIPAGYSVVIKAHSRNISKIRGLKNKNIEFLKNRFHVPSVKVIHDDFMDSDALEIDLEPTT